MDKITWIAAALCATGVLGAVGWLAWRHRARMNEMQRRLAWNEQSRFELEQQTQELDQRLASMAQTLKALETSRSLEATLSQGDARAARRTVPGNGWRDTEPMAAEPSPYAQTMPLALGEAEVPPPAAPRSRPRS
jgi:uncharacterized membrane-anchored protein YhcB (DUF1043 family)